MGRLAAAIKWHGGKHYLAPWIIAEMPAHLHYVEPYFGGGAVLFAKNQNGVSEVVNDLNGELMNFWNVLRDPLLFDQFRRLVDATPFSQSLFRQSLKPQYGTAVSRAWAFFVRFRQSRQGLGKDFATVSRNRTRRGMNEQVSSWLSAIEGLPEIHQRLRRVLILCDDSLKVIKQQDGPSTLFYCDPPYLAETRSSGGEYGTFEMSKDIHIKLLRTLAGISGKFILSGYRSLLYHSFASQHGWRCIEIEIDNKASGAKKKEIKTECLWMNF